MKKLQNFKDLIVWQLASRFSNEVARLVDKFPKKEQYALTDDLLRAARSMPSNISEGFGRYHIAEKIQFYNIASASAEECSNHLIEAYNNGFISKETENIYQRKLHVIAVKITNLIISTRKRIKSSGRK